MFEHRLYTHQFAAVEKIVLAVPYVSITEQEKITRETNKRSITKCDTKREFKSIQLTAISICEEHQGNVEELLLQAFKEKDLADEIQYRKSPVMGRECESEESYTQTTHLLEIGEPVTIYDPEWVR